MNDEAFEKIKRITKLTGGKTIIVEDGKPTFIIEDVDRYLSISDEKQGDSDSEIKLVNRINREILDWKGRQRERELRQMEDNFLDKS